MARLDEFSLASEFIKTLTILNAVRWVAEAWNLVKEGTVKKCFRKAGILNLNFSIVTLDPILSSDDGDPFTDLDIDHNEDDEDQSAELGELISCVQTENECSVQDLIEAENCIPICQEFANENWEDEFFSELGPASKSLTLETDDEGSDSDVCIVEMSKEDTLKITNFSEAIKSLDEIIKYLEKKGHTTEATNASTLMTSLVHLSYKTSTSCRQTSITDFF